MTHLKVTPLYLVDMEEFEAHSYKNWVN